MRRVALAVLLCLAGAAGCGLIAGVGDPYGFSAYPTDAAHDGTVGAADAQDTGAPTDGAALDVSDPPDVTFADANELPPPPAEAGCVSPTPCNATSSLCCAPGVCNASNKCVGSCKSKGQGGCGNTAACCVGLSCTENLECQTACIGDPGAPCDSLNPCCVGLVCPQQDAGARCQQCLPRYLPCRHDWECCGKRCFGLCN